jgi:glucokinase
MPEAGEVFIGVDIGGTKVAAGLVNPQGEILHKARTSMHARGTADEALGCVRTAIDMIRNEHPDVRVGGIGLVSPGPVDPETGTVLNPSNLPCWRNYPLGAEIRKAYDLPTQVHNDANAAGLAEAMWGAGRGYKCMFYAALGTGVGTAITYNAQLYLGRTGAAGEGGHMSIDYHGARCRCGKAGCIETLAGGWAIAARAQEKLAREATRGKRIVRLAGGQVEKVTSETLAQAWEEGDPLATEMLRETADILAVWFGNIVDLLEPDIIVVGGGLSSLMARWFDRIASQLPFWSVNARCSEIPFAEAKYGADSGIAGAAALCISLTLL